MSFSNSEVMWKPLLFDLYETKSVYLIKHNNYFDIILLMILKERITAIFQVHFDNIRTLKA